ncbi:MAG: ABC transporter permease subunit, partial [Coriobacteriales bacterium]|nr:ABC transporter permease subunit [Coriobacteriales bacterium]
AGFLLASLLPFLMMILLFTGSMSIAPESIAGEKERGTIATLLVTPLKRWELALGKMVSISCIALLSGTSSFLGFMLSLPRMVGGAAEGMGALYGVTDYLLLFAVIVSTVMLFVGLISLISAYARTIKEATTSVSPLMVLAMLVGVMAMFSSEAQASPLFYLIPAYNSVQSMVGIFSFTGNPLLVLETVVVNLAIAAVCVVVLTKMFNNEKIVFAR